MALFSTPMIPRDGTITIQDATGSPIVLTVQYEDGDFQHDPFEEGFMEHTILKDRGVDFAIRKVQEQALSFSFSCMATDFKDGTEKTIPDAVLKTGAFASGNSVFGANADAWGVQVKFEAEQTNYGASADSSVTFAKCRISYGFAEGVPGKFTIKGIVFNPSQTITIV